MTLDPLSPIVQDQLVYPLIGLGRLDEAQTALDKLQQAHPEFAQAYSTQAVLGVARDDLVAALRGYRENEARDPGAVGRFRDRCWALIRFGAASEALRCLDDLMARWPAAVELKRDRLEIELVDARSEPAQADLHKERIAAGT